MLYPNEFPLQDVVLLDGPFKHARDLNLRTLLKYDIDRILEPFLREAGLQPRGEMYPNWEGLAGHIGGHYLSAMAMNYAATGNTECKRRMEYMISELRACQEANGINLHPHQLQIAIQLYLSLFHLFLFKLLRKRQCRPFPIPRKSGIQGLSPIIDWPPPVSDILLSTRVVIRTCPNPATASPFTGSAET